MKESAVEQKYEEMARQMRADGVSEAMIARFVAEEMEEDEFRRGKGVTEIEALREWRKTPEHIRKLLLANAFCHNCGTTGSRPATRCACATTACSSRVAAQNAAPKSRGCATDVAAVERLPLGNIALVAPLGASNL